MIQRRAGETTPTDQDITATFKKIQKIIPVDQVATITQARDSIGGLLGICLALYDAWQKLDLAVSVDSKQKELAVSISTLQEAKEGLAKTLEIAKADHSVAITTLANELETKKTSVENEKIILNTEIHALEEEKISLAGTLAESKKTFDAYTVATLQAKDDELARLQKKIDEAEVKLAKTQKAFDILKAKLE